MTFLISFLKGSIVFGLTLEHHPIDSDDEFNYNYKCYQDPYSPVNETKEESNQADEQKEEKNQQQEENHQADENNQENNHSLLNQENNYPF
ncbi:hypothetical protein DICPUDRAFT_155428 [Dictyostelium purpureum]|uniref:Uncharacterized protein n=1 Tax=Dictyostelium purpureum TaxID=5786 RepID=F0ZTZ8_DICPU|nr:uncharacterized protein DICPUDRAFT_155428 [Dictyostelium purpureum]EGC32591.1 hypothetical protein DICPUDRAFT_155428 [Dictyostelium purpureum]|eukprot:XP_003290882.1 hypothetical protein DICPUDRAFT_155428 [Dictyostelium purpureum]